MEAAEDYEVVLHVGGGRFRARRNTLLASESFLAALVSGRWGDKRKPVFLDGDAAAFREVLRYLRDPENYTVPPPGARKRALHAQARALSMTALQELSQPLAVLRSEDLVVGRREESIELAWTSLGCSIVSATLAVPCGSFDVELRIDDGDGGGIGACVLGLAGAARCDATTMHTQPVMRLWNARPTTGFAMKEVGGAVVQVQEEEPLHLVHECLRAGALPQGARSLRVWPARRFVVKLRNEVAEQLSFAFAICGLDSSSICAVYDTGFEAAMPDGSTCRGLTTWDYRFGPRSDYEVAAAFCPVEHNHTCSRAFVFKLDKVSRLLFSRRGTFLNLGIVGAREDGRNGRLDMRTRSLGDALDLKEARLVCQAAFGTSSALHLKELSAEACYRRDLREDALDVEV